MSRSPSRAALGLVLAYITALGVVADPAPAAAQWADTLSLGTQTDGAALIAAPSGLGDTVACPASSALDSEVNLTWTASAALDADGNYQIGYYGVWRGVDGAPTACSPPPTGRPRPTP